MPIPTPEIDGLRRFRVDSPLRTWVPIEGFTYYEASEVDALLVQRAQAIAEVKAKLADVDVIRKDASELRSSLGFILMRCAVAESGQDAYDVCQREFKEHEAALLRLEKMLPAYGSSEWHALQRERIDDATGMGRTDTSAEVEEKVPDVQDAVGDRHRAVRGDGALLPNVPEDCEALPDSAAARVAEGRAEKAEQTLGRNATNR